MQFTSSRSKRCDGESDIINRFVFPVGSAISRPPSPIRCGVERFEPKWALFKVDHHLRALSRFVKIPRLLQKPVTVRCSSAGGRTAVIRYWLSAKHSPKSITEPRFIERSHPENTYGDESSYQLAKQKLLISTGIFTQSNIMPRNIPYSSTNTLAVNIRVGVRDHIRVTTETPLEEWLDPQTGATNETQTISGTQAKTKSSVPPV